MTKQILKGQQATSKSCLLNDLFNNKAREAKAKGNKASNIIISGFTKSKNKSDLEEISTIGNFVKKTYRIIKTRKENKSALLKVHIMGANKLKEIERYTRKSFKNHFLLFIIYYASCII
ncbi:hypothetical protein BpHYR1_052756 [Brachionus plicatilis]|uniref:Uncharacterized protein n=1 Tax=Brachionus plicatilis TaxID=10195 RepID=A0A3M7PS08_BRAPC|nr:hypothetical protein BpHYR1_052756 [Brachionus plicatilis]